MAAFRGCVERDGHALERTPRRGVRDLTRCRPSRRSSRLLNFGQIAVQVIQAVLADLAHFGRLGGVLIHGR